MPQNALAEKVSFAAQHEPPLTTKYKQTDFQLSYRSEWPHQTKAAMIQTERDNLRPGKR